MPGGGPTLLSWLSCPLAPGLGLLGLVGLLGLLGLEGLLGLAGREDWTLWLAEKSKFSFPSLLSCRNESKSKSFNTSSEGRRFAKPVGSSPGSKNYTRSARNAQRKMRGNPQFDLSYPPLRVMPLVGPRGEIHRESESTPLTERGRRARGRWSSPWLCIVC